MTDLREQWDDFPTSPAPLSAIMRAVRVRRRRRRRPVLIAGLSTAVAAVLFAMALVDAGGAGPVADDVRPVAFAADLDPVADCAELLSIYRDRGARAVSPWGWGPVATGYSRLAVQAARADSIGASATGTNVQEPGVDEPDAVKTNGRLAASLVGARLVVHDVSGAHPVRVGELRLPRFADGELLLAGATVVAIGRDRASSGTRVVTVAIGGATPRIVSTVVYSSRLLAARLSATTVRLVLAEDPPALSFVEPNADVTVREARAANRRTVRASALADWMPTVDRGDGARPLLDCRDAAVPDGTGVSTVSVVGFRVDDPAPSAVALVGSAATAYASTDRVYLADRPALWCWGACAARRDRTDVTRVYEFALDGVRATHVASGRAPGLIADRWSMDEHDGVLRAAVDLGGENAVVTMTRRGDELVELGRAAGLGPGEDIMSVRWFDDLAVVVTFRQVDPLYTVDLSDQRRPRVLGELKIPGYSGYLHPVGPDLLMGVGFADAGRETAQASLFDIADPRRARRVAAVRYRGAWPLAADDPRAFVWLPEQERALTVLRRDGDLVIASLVVAGEDLAGEVTVVDRQARRGPVRTLPLPDGRVLLAVGDDVELFDLS